MPKSLLSDYCAWEITGEVLLYETRAYIVAALGSHWTKSNKYSHLLSTIRCVGVEELTQNIKAPKIRKNSAVNLVLISTTPPVYDVRFKGLLHPLSKII